MDIILASQSPRRQELLKRIAPEFRVVPSGVDEESFWERDPLRFALRAAEAKAREVGEKYPSSLIIAADTVVSLRDEIFGKPKDLREAIQILEKLSGQRHRVITALALFKKDDSRLLTGYEISHVTFKTLVKKEIEDYLEMNDYLDKAGSYAVQEVGDTFVERLEGDYDNVVGFPLARAKKLLAEFAQPDHPVTITDIAFPHDWGVGKIDGIVTFVPEAVIGDKVRAVVAKAKKRHHFGRIVGLESASPFRVEPECSHFGDCGGCAFQNLDYSKQLELKEKYLLRTVQKIGRLNIDDVEKEPITGSPAVYFYRGKMEYAFGSRGRDVFIGLRERASPLETLRKNTVAIQRCPIFSLSVEQIFPIFIDFAVSTGLDVYNPINTAGFLRNLVLREGKNSGEIMAILVTRGGRELDLVHIADNLRKNVPRVKSLWWVENDRIPDLVDFQKKRHIAGEKYIEERLGELRFRIYPESFFQPNPKAAELLYRRIITEVQHLGVRRVLGLYCGSGSIEISVSPSVDEVVGIDSEPMNIATAEENCLLNGTQNCRFIEGRVESVLKGQDFKDFDLLVVDPPRAGISSRALKQIAALGIANFIYVSCNPAALSRDLSLLIEKGYHLKKLACFDFFPHTPHLESVAVLAK